MNVVDTLLRVELLEPGNFLVIKETLTRIGVASRKEKKLFQSCHILHKRGNYYIVSFKEMFALDGKSTTISEDDIGRRNKIASLLEEWGLLKIVDADKFNEPMCSINQIKIIPFKDKESWELIEKYTVGQRH